MRRTLRRALILSTCVIAFAAAAATAAKADDSSGDDAQLEDVSKQVSSIQKKIDELLGHGQWARAGRLLADADCGYGDPSSQFAAWGDDASYVLAPQGDPTIRFFGRDSGGNEKSQLKVDVLYEDFGGHIKRLTIARLRAGSEWEPSLVLPIYMNVLAAASPSGVTAVAFRFKAEGLQKDETLSISSLYVDPLKMG
jgi:hypothetical protein